MTKMIAPRTPRGVAWAALALAGVSGLSALPLSPYVASGDYDRDRAHAADCTRPWTPSPEGWASETPGVLGEWGGDLERRYRPATPDMVAYNEDGTMLTVAEDATTGRRSLTISVTTGDTTCQRLTVVGGSTLTTLPASREVWPNPPSGSGIGTLYSKDLNTRGVKTMFSRINGGDPGDGVVATYDIAGGGYSTQGSRVLYTVNGAPGRDVDLVISTVILDRNFPRGIAGMDRYYKDWAIQSHKHDVTPSIMVTGADRQRHPRLPGATQVPQRLQPVVVRTGPDGTAPIKIWPGFRGGVEFLRIHVKSAQAQGNREMLRQDTLYYPVLIRSAGDLMHISELVPNAQRFLGQTGNNNVFGYQVTPTREYPFVLVGHTPRHPNAHYLRRDVAEQAAGIARAMWNYQFGSRSLRGSALETHQFLRFNDMSLRFGGLFKISSGDCDAMGGSHQGHDTGQEVDLSPYLGTSTCTNVAGRVSCSLSTGGYLDESFLGKVVVSEYKGVILEEDGGGGHHYHLRLRTNSGNSWEYAKQILVGS